MLTGDRFKMFRDIDRFPAFVAQAGLTGTIIGAAEDVWGRIDQPVRAAEEWDNELY